MAPNNRLNPIHMHGDKAAASFLKFRTVQICGACAAGCKTARTVAPACAKIKEGRRHHFAGSFDGCRLAATLSARRSTAPDPGDRPGRGGYAAGRRAGWGRTGPRRRRRPGRRLPCGCRHRPWWARTFRPAKPRHPADRGAGVAAPSGNRRGRAAGGLAGTLALHGYINVLQRQIGCFKHGFDER